jgi:adenosylcobinamide-phosphate synthase
MAGALNIQLGGCAFYDGVKHERPLFGSGPAPAASDLARGLKIYVRACAGLWIVIGAVGLA